MFLLLSLNVFGQGRTDPQTLNFQNIDGFSGYVKFNTFYEGFATQLKANSGVLVIRGYSKVSRDELEALRKAGINLENYKPEKFQFVVEGTAFVKDYAVNNLYKHSAIDKSILKINHNMGDFTTPTFSDDVRKMTKEWSEKNGNQSYWERFGGFTPSRVTELYLLELKNEIDRILQEYKREKAQKEKEEKAKKEASSEKKDDTVADSDKKSTSLKSDSGQESKNNENDSSEKENKSESKKTMVYIPKTNTQMYNELKEMTDKNPSLLNNSETRQRLRHLKVDSEREQQINRDYRSGVYNLNSNTLSQYISSNQKIDTYKKVGGDITDAAVGLVNAIYAEGDRKQADRTSVHENNKTKASSKEESIKAWEEEIEKSRKEFKLNVQNNIKETGYNLIKTLEVGVINYETEKRNKDKGEGYWKGSRYYYNPIEFDKITKRLDNKYIYIVETNDLFGILDDAGNAIYPPQFSGIYVLLRNNKTPRILIKINDKWGEILADGSIVEEVKYDGIWYYPNKEKKILKHNNNWEEKSIDNNQLLGNYSSEVIAKKNSGGLIPVINTTFNKYNPTGNYSLDIDGQIHKFGENTEDSGENSKEYESVRRGQSIEKLYKKNGKWFITAGYGTKNMTIVEMPQKFVVEALRETENGKKWGAINQDEEIIIPFEHTFIRRTTKGFTTDKGDYNINN
jgi:hypothetical protein